MCSVPPPEVLRRLDIRLDHDGQRLRLQHHARPAESRQDPDQQRQFQVPHLHQRAQHDQDADPRHHDHDVGQPHQQHVDQSAKVRRRCPYHRSDAHRHHRRQQPQQELRARAEHQLAQDVPAQRIGAQRVAQAGRRRLLGLVKCKADDRVVDPFVPDRVHQDRMRQRQQHVEADDHQSQDSDPRLKEQRPVPASGCGPPAPAAPATARAHRKRARCRQPSVPNPRIQVGVKDVRRQVRQQHEQPHKHKGAQPPAAGPRSPSRPPASAPCRATRRSTR